MSYRYVLVDPRTNAVRDEVPLSGVGFSYELNGPGGFSATLPLSLTSKFGLPIAYELVNSSNFQEGNTALYVERDGTVVWGGLLWDFDISVEEDKLAIGGQGFFSYFDHRLIRKTHHYTTPTEQFTIAQNLIDDVQAATGGNLGATIVKVPAAGSGVLRTATYDAFERAPLGQKLRDLAALQNGFDFHLFVGGNLGSGGTLTRQLQLWYPQMGRVTDFVWEIGKNIQLLQYRSSATNKAQSVTAIGAGEGKSMLIADTSDLALLASELLLERADAYKDITRQTTLTARAQSNLNRYKRGERTMTVKVVDKVETPLGSFIPGDQIRVRAKRGLLNIDEMWRVMTYTVNPDDASNETIEVELAPVSAFGV